MQPHNRALHRPDVTGRICKNVTFGTVCKKLDYNTINKYADMSSEDLEVGKKRKCTEFDEFTKFSFRLVVLCIGHKHNLQK